MKLIPKAVFKASKNLNFCFIKIMVSRIMLVINPLIIGIPRRGDHLAKRISDNLVSLVLKHFQVRERQTHIAVFHNT